jgi:hypothetical protein
MTDFTITTLVTKSDYIKFIYGSIYKKPAFILATIVGLYLVGTVALHYLHIITYYSETPYTEIISGIFILLSPTIIALMAAKGHYTNPSLQHEITYTFGEDGINVKGLTFESVLKWTHVVKQKETKKYLLLFCSNKQGNFIDKSKLTLDQIKFIKSHIGQK